MDRALHTLEPHPIAPLNNYLHRPRRTHPRQRNGSHSWPRRNPLRLSNHLKTPTRIDELDLARILALHVEQSRRSDQNGNALRPRDGNVQPIQNTPEFQKAWGCHAGQPMVRANMCKAL